jgi:hypothetical protein
VGASGDITGKEFMSQKPGDLWWTGKEPFPNLPNVDTASLAAADKVNSLIQRELGCLLDRLQLATLIQEAYRLDD